VSQSAVIAARAAAESLSEDTRCMIRRISICFFALFLASIPSQGAELFYMDHDSFTDRYVGPTGPLVISGEIAPGDYDRLLSKIMDDESRFMLQNEIILASDGGDVAESMKIGALVRSLFTGIVVGPLTGRCVSACFFIYAAAGQREADGARLIGINRPYLVDSDAASSKTDPSMAETRALMQVRAFLSENAVPTYLVEEMFRHASDDAYWLSADDEKNLGHRSPSFDRYLKAKCAWEDGMERDVLAGKRSVDDFKQMLKCRAVATQADAHKALSQAVTNRRAAPMPSPPKRAATDGPAESAPPKSSSE
jgi:ATP-dependent protease ClpP protease subunit